MIDIGFCNILAKLGLNSIKCKNVFFSNKIEPLHVSANDGHHQKATNISLKHIVHLNTTTSQPHPHKQEQQNTDDLL
jgi:hypothetical protein